jgi:hypothetical protein
VSRPFRPHCNCTALCLSIDPVEASRQEASILGCLPEKALKESGARVFTTLLHQTVTSGGRHRADCQMITSNPDQVTARDAHKTVQSRATQAA